MDYMVMDFPDDVRDARAREGRNISETERWASMATGVGLAAYGISRLSGRGWMRLQYSPPGGKVGDAVARLLGHDAATQIREDLRRFKETVETGERTR